ncbi:hypothetical protein GCM10009589_10060 [Arthrobacter pascens]
MGMENGALRSSLGRMAATKTARPAAAKIMLAASNMVASNPARAGLTNTSGESGPAAAATGTSAA